MADYVLMREGLVVDLGFVDLLNKFFHISL